MNYTNLVTPQMLQKGNTEQELFDALLEASLFKGKIMYVGRLVQRAAYLHPNKTALICRELTITFKELYARAVGVSLLLKQMGIKPRDRVILWWENSIEFYIAYFGISQIGAIVAPLNVYLKESEVLHIINDAKPSAVIISDELRKKLSLSDDQLPTMIGQKEIDIQITPVPQINNFDITDLEPEEMAVLLYTSGTTGFPKGVMTSSKNIITNILQGIARIRFGLDEHERMIALLPLFHSFSQFTAVWGSMLVCCTVIVVPRIDRRYILEGLKHKPTLFMAVPAMYGLLCLLKTAPLDSIKFFVSGGDAMPDKIRGAFELIYRRKICNGFGLTETTPLLSAYMDDQAVDTNTVGYPVYGVQTKIIDEKTERELAQGQIGQLWVKGDNVMLGYYNAPEMTAQVLKDGWFCTGDLAFFDERNRLVIAGRTKDLIINKGFNIYPQEIENILMSHPAVIRAAVIGVKLNGDSIPVAYVQVNQATERLEAELRELCVKELASYKHPRSYVITTKSLPTTATGKIDKKRLHEFDSTKES